VPLPPSASRELTLNALAFRLQQIAHRLQLTNEVVDFLQRRVPHALQHASQGAGNCYTFAIGSTTQRRHLAAYGVVEFIFQFTLSSLRVGEPFDHAHDSPPF
jgi:hypothetical protein